MLTLPIFQQEISTLNKVNKIIKALKRREKRDINSDCRIYRSGFSLLELLITIVILLVAICGFLMAFYNSIVLNESNKNQTIAVNDAQYVLEHIKTLSYDDIDSYSPPTLTNLNNENITKQVSEIETNLKRVTVNVSWLWRQRNRSLSLSTLIAK